MWVKLTHKIVQGATYGIETYTLLIFEDGKLISTRSLLSRNACLDAWMRFVKQVKAENAALEGVKA